MTFRSNPQRDAWSTIAGFVLQIDLTILRWLNLAPDEVLELERGEDIDTVQEQVANRRFEQGRLLEQVKRRSKSLTLKSPEALEALANFCSHREVNPGIRLRFRFVTTTSASKERNWKRDGNGIETWEAIRTRKHARRTQKAALAEIRKVIQSARKPQKVNAPLWHRLKALIAVDKTFHQFITSFEWSLNSGDFGKTEDQIKEKLYALGFAPSTADAEHLFNNRLFFAVIKILRNVGLKSLAAPDLHNEIRKGRLSDSDYSLVTFIRSSLTELKERVVNLEVGLEKSNASLGSLRDAVNTIASERIHMPPLSRPPGARGRDRDLFYGYAVQFVGRAKELSELRTFMMPRDNVATDFAWWIWTAPGGQGKTRLVAQLCSELETEKHWRSGFLPMTTDFNDWDRWIVEQPTFVVIDQVASRAEYVRNAICALSRQGNLRAPLRLLLLERPFSRQDDWVRDFLPENSTQDMVELFEHAYIPVAAADPYDLKAATRELGRLDRDSQWQIVLAATQGRAMPPMDPDSMLDMLASIDPLLRPLFLILAVDAISARGLDGVRKWNVRDLVQFIMRREFELWRKMLLGNQASGAAAASFEEHVNLIALSTIAGSPSDGMYKLLQQDGVLLPARQLPDWLRVITGYSSGTAVASVPRLEPDVLGEVFVLERWAGGFGTDSNLDVPRDHTQAVMNSALARHRYQTIDFIRRCIEDFPDHPSIERFPDIQMPEGKNASFGFYMDHTVHMGVIARILADAKRPDLAERCFEQLIQQGYRFTSGDEARLGSKIRLATALYNRGLLRAQQNKVEAATSDCDEVIGLINESALHQQATGLAEYELDDLITRTRLLRSALHAEAGQLLQAEKDLAQALDSQIAELRGEALLARARLHFDTNDEQSLADYEAILAMEGPRLNEVKRIATKRAAELLWEMARGRQRSGESADGLRYLSRIIELTDDRPELQAMARVNRGLLRLEMRDTTGAEHDWTTVLEHTRAPMEQKRKALINRGQSFLVRGLIDAAGKDVETLLRDGQPAGRDLAFAHLTRARVRHHSGDHSGAADDLKMLQSDSSVDQDIRDLAARFHQSWYGQQTTQD